MSSNQNVAIFSGAYCTNMPNNVGAGDNGDLVRVLAVENSTEVFVNGVLVSTLNAGEVLEIDNVTDGMITSSLPITVGQFIRGLSGSRTTGTRPGNPGPECTGLAGHASIKKAYAVTLSEMI